jgi:3-phenylpropionate/cinnamic acid dioxygenase small subunit
MTINHQALTNLIYLDALLLDEERYDEWLALFAEDGRYWVPLKGRLQTQSEKFNAIADEDRLLLALRIDRLKAGRAHSQQPTSSMQHVLQAPMLMEAHEGAGAFVLRTAFSYAESRGEDLVTLHGHYIHRIVTVDGQLRIALKRVNLVNAHARLPMIQLFP